MASSPKRSTSYDVARLAGVSRTTVSLVLNNAPNAHISPETRQRVLEAAHKLHYYPHASARRLAQGRTATVALVWHRGPDADYRDAFLPALLQGITRALRQHGYHLIFRPLEPDEPDDAFLELAQGRHADGLILSGPRADSPYLEALHQQGFPLVLHGQLPDSDIPWVDVDNRQGARQATEHLLSLGHRRIGMITNAPLDYVASRQRLEGYRQALAEAGVTPDEAWVQWGNFDEESGYRAMQKLLACLPRPTAVFVASDMVALGALKAVWDAGLRVPQDVAIVGFDDLTTTRFTIPPLTTVRVPAFRLGQEAGNLLIEIITRGKAFQPHILLQTSLIVRASCGAAITPKGGESAQ
ncbi:MAG TPA: LacI family transcriptional regulator [Chloroflexi bacterium]|nr:LacI family transcriptional regulator [Chloroflexota bacterium]